MGFILSKLFWVFLSPGNFLALVLVAAAFMGSSQNEACRKIGRRGCLIVALLFFLIGIFPVGEWMLVPLENLYPPETPQNVAGLILLGGDEKPGAEAASNRPVFLDSARRYITFASLARRYPSAKLVYSGGSPRIMPITGEKKFADVAKRALLELGVPVEKMLFEDTSHNTRENATLTFDLVHPQANQTWLLVTSAFHMPRAMMTFQKAGWNVAPATAGYLTDGTYSTRLQFNLGEHLMEMAWAAHEYYGLIAYRLLGYTDHLWPS